MGAAIIGGVGCGVPKDFDVASKFISITHLASPDPATVTVYSHAKKLLNGSYDALAPLFPRFGQKVQSTVP